MDEITIRHKIYEMRGQRVMLDFDLAAAYGVETAQLKRQVRRNMERFEGEDFMFEVTREELLRCQIGTLNVKQGQNIKYLPFAFTELGVAMLSGVLRSKTAIKVNREIMRAFVALRHLVALPETSDRLKRIEEDIRLIKEDMEDSLSIQNEINEDTRAQLGAISEALAQLQSNNPQPRRPILGFSKPSDEK